MDLLNWMFLGFAAIAVFSAAGVIFAKNPVRAVLFLILTFISTAATWVLLGAEFLAITLVLVYVGAVIVLFLFVVMMLDVDFATLRAKFTRWSPVGLALAIGFFLILRKILLQGAGQFTELDQAAVESSNVALLGQSVFTKYLFQFEVAGIILLVAIISAIALIFRGPRDRKTQNIAAQIAANPRDRVRLVSGE